MPLDRTRLLSSFLLLLALLANGCGIAPAGKSLSPAQPTQPPNYSTTQPSNYQTTQLPNHPTTQLTDLIGDILAEPATWAEQPIEIIGYYRGWDVLHETQQAPPVTRSDWVIADASGAIYVTGLRPPGLDPATQADSQTVLHLFATVKYIEQSKRVYLRAERVELVRD